MSVYQLLHDEFMRDVEAEINRQILGLPRPEPTPEQRLSRAQSAVRWAREEVALAEDELAEAQDRLDEMRSELAVALRSLVAVLKEASS